MKRAEKEIQRLVNLETKAWNKKNVELLLSLIHPDMVWCWPPDENAHNPEKWIYVMGRFNRARWKKLWQKLFDDFSLVHNKRKIIKIVTTEENDGGHAVVDVDTLWQHKITGEKSHWRGRACKIYSRLRNGQWKLIAHTGLLNYKRK